MTDPLTAPPLDPLSEAMGRAAMAIKTRPLLVPHDGDRRRFADRTPGGANLTTIQGGKQ